MRVPKDKFDIEAFEDLNEDFVVANQEVFLEWIQDINWPVANQVARILPLYLEEIQKSIVNVLRRNDYVWKFNIISIILYSAKNIPESIKAEVVRIYNDNDEIDEIKESCFELMKVC